MSVSPPALGSAVQKAALESARIIRQTDTTVTIGWRERQTKLARQTVLTGEEFLRRFLQHVLPPGFIRVRHGGFYSPAARTQYGALCTQLEHDPKPATEVETWTPQCSECGGRMQVQFIQVGSKIIVPKRAILPKTDAVAPHRPQNALRSSVFAMAPYIHRRSISPCRKAAIAAWSRPVVWWCQNVPNPIQSGSQNAPSYTRISQSVGIIGLADCQIKHDVSIRTEKLHRVPKTGQKHFPIPRKRVDF